MNRPFALLDLPGGGAALFESLRQTLTVCRASDFDATCRAAEAAAENGLHVVALLDYELGHVLEPCAGSDAYGGRARFFIFGERTDLDAAALAGWLANRAGNPLRAAGLIDFRPTLDAAGHAAAVQRIRDYIAAGDCYQVNFTFFFSGRCAGDPLALYARLRQAQPVSCGGLLLTDDEAVLSLSPELFIERRSGRIVARPMKGTAPRAVADADDAAAAAALRESAKDRAENVMIVDLIRNDLGRVARAGSVVVDRLCEIESYPSVHQMVSDISAASDADLATVLRAMFPCGSITGAPKLRAMEIIRELEGGARGLYTGALGWLGRGGEFRFNVAIRTLTIDKAGAVRMGIGSGIVWDSDATAEYQECLLKARFARAFDPGVRLIETLRLSHGRFPLLTRHLQRLMTSAAALGFACDTAALDIALQQLASANAGGVFRVRLTLGHAGDFDVISQPLTPTPDGQRCVISPVVLASDDPWLCHKTTERGRYDAELARVTADPEVFDAIFLNERGEVCEGARSNVFVRRQPGDRLITPPVGSGLLPGVLRSELLTSGEADEGILTLDDLRRAHEIFLGNALRGLVKVVLKD